MARHTIGNKRGSVRGAPPDVYAGFLSETRDNRDFFQEAFRFFRMVGFGLLMIFLVGITFVLLIAVGILPEDF